MGHPAKHPIDPDTGLCDICDRDAIREIRLGRRPARRIVYVDHEEDVINRPPEEERIVYVQEERPYVVEENIEPQVIRKTLPAEPAVRTRRIIYEQPPVEEPMMIRRVVRRDRAPQEEVIVRRRDPVPTTHYYIEREGERIPRISSPPREIIRRHIVPYRSPPPPPAVLPPVKTRAVRVISRRAETPPPVIMKTYRPSPRRQTNSDTQIVEREQRIRREEYNDEPAKPVGRPELYHLDAGYAAEDDFQRFNTPDQVAYEDRRISPIRNTNTTRTVYQNGENRQRTRVERIEQPPQEEPRPIPTVVKRSYKKAPPGQDPTFDTSRGTNGTSRFPPRKGAKNQVTRQYASSPFLNTDRSNDPSTKDPAIYYIRPGGGS